MRFLRNSLLPFFFLLAGAGRGLHAQEAAPAPDVELTVLENRLQAERAATLRSRLSLYADELLQLHARMEAAGDTAAGSILKELEAVRHDLKQLEGLARGQEQDAPAAAKRIDTIVTRLERTRHVPVSPQASGTGTAATRDQPRLRVLRPEKAILTGGPAESGKNHWARAGSAAAWTLAGIAPGDYEVMLRYTGSPQSGGKAVIVAGNQRLEVTVPAGEKGTPAREQRLDAGTLKIKEPDSELRIVAESLREGAGFLWNLESVQLQPAARRP